MTASAVVTPPRPASLLTSIGGWIRRRSGEALVFAAATGLALVHALDDAFLAGLGPHTLAGVVALVASVAAVVAFPSLRPGVRAAIAFSFGVLAMTNGGRHAHHVLSEGATATANDVTGMLALAGGAVLVGLAAAGVLSVVFVFFPVGMAIVDIHSLHRPVGSPPNAAYETVSFTASDGVDLEGWYRPSRNGASVLMISGGGGNRRSTLRHAKMLERHGYGVLVYDPRGSGNSEGMINSYGWGWEKDAAAALDFLAAREDVEPGRVGTLGLSTGADIAIDIAARRND